MAVRTNQWLKDAFMERDPDDYNRDLVDTFGNWRGGQGLGQTFYVNLGGDDGNPGTDPADPFLTIAGALAACTADNLDTIFVLDYWANDAVWPIDVDVSRVRIIGSPGAGASWPTVGPVGDFASFSVTAPYVEIARMSIGGGVTAGCIEMGGDHWGLWVRQNFFGVVGVGQDGVRIPGAPGPAYDAPYLLVTGNRFGQGLTRDGVRVEHNATRSFIGHYNGGGNFFDRIPGIGVNVVGNAVQVGVHNNTFAMETDTAGDAITFAAGTSLCSASGNSAHYGKAAMAQNPYRDLGNANNSWGINYSGVVALMPAVV